jgi:hypothetical protein
VYQLQQQLARGILQLIFSFLLMLTILLNHRKAQEAVIGNTASKAKTPRGPATKNKGFETAEKPAAVETVPKKKRASISDAIKQFTEESAIPVVGNSSSSSSSSSSAVNAAPIENLVIASASQNGSSSSSSSGDPTSPAPVKTPVLKINGKKIKPNKAALIGATSPVAVVPVAATTGDVKVAPEAVVEAPKMSEKKTRSKAVAK